MFVGERMSRPVISVSPQAPINEILAMFKKEHIRRAPVMKNGKLLGIVSERDLLNASASSATTLSVWELNYLISKVTVKDVMTRNVVTVDRDTPIEDAARIMADTKIGGLPVTSAGKVIGMITETDLFKIFLVTKAIANNGGDFLAFGMFAGPDANSRLITFKVEGMTKEKVKEALNDTVLKFWDIRQN
jgi:acetoin utilization protein AcuB